MVNILLTKDSFTLAAGGQSKTINEDSADFQKLVDLYRASDEKGLEEYLLSFKKKIETPYKSKGFTVEEDRVKIGNDFLPTYLGNRLKNHADQGLPVDRLLKSWEKLKENPSHNSVNALHQFGELNNLPITPEGNFVAYKAVDKDLKDKHTHTIDNSPGSLVEKDRRDVDDDFRQACSTGLHVGGFRYVSSFGNAPGDRFIEVEFDPADVVSVPTYEDKIRVCRYKVIREIKREEVVAFEGEHYNLPSLSDEDDDEEDYCPYCENYYSECDCD